MELEPRIVVCRMCRDIHTVYVKPEDFQAWIQGGHIQKCMKYLSADERELLISGTCQKCWERIFGGDENE